MKMLLRSLIALALATLFALDAGAANRFWVGGTGTWDGSDTTHWAASSGGAGGQSVPGASDAVIFDGSSGGGTVTVNTNANIFSLTMGAFTGTLDYSANNNNLTAAFLSVTGTATRTLNLGAGTFTFTGGNTCWDATTTTNLTFNAGTSTIIAAFNGGNSAGFAGGGLTYRTLEIGTGSSVAVFGYVLSGNNTFHTLRVKAGAYFLLVSGTTQTVTDTFSAAGSSAAPCAIHSSLLQATISAPASSSIDWCSILNMAFTTTAIAATNSFNLQGSNNMNGGSITAPAAGVKGIIGGG